MVRYGILEKIVLKKKKKKILYILDRPLYKFTSNRQHTNWIYDCSNMKFKFWGKRTSDDLSIRSLKNKIDNFRPDYIYLTVRKRYEDWLPDLTSIKNVPKIFVEMDTWKYSSTDPWYRQFNILKCRCPWWNGWDKVPFFQWSVPEKSFAKKEVKRDNIYFIGQWKKRKYPMRVAISRKYGDRIKFFKIEGDEYWEVLHRAGAVICPTESKFGNFIPAKLFEYLASGSAVITNCNMHRAGLGELKSSVIKYKDLNDIGNKLDIDFTRYHNKAIEVMRQNTHIKRYKDLFK